MLKVGNKIKYVEELVRNFNQTHFSAHGFTLAFQLLFFKAIPALERFIPEFNDEQTFTDKSIVSLSHLKNFHNLHIMETENLPNVSTFFRVFPFINVFANIYIFLAFVIHYSLKLRHYFTLLILNMK